MPIKVFGVDWTKAFCICKKRLTSPFPLSMSIFTDDNWAQTYYQGPWRSPSYNLKVLWMIGCLNGVLGSRSTAYFSLLSPFGKLVLCWHFNWRGRIITGCYTMLWILASLSFKCLSWYGRGLTASIMRGNFSLFISSMNFEFLWWRTATRVIEFFSFTRALLNKEWSYTAMLKIIEPPRGA